MQLAWILDNWWPAGFGNQLLLLLESAVCLGTALVCGLLVGHQRQRMGKPAGIRTHVLVCLGSAGFVHLGCVAYKVGDLGTLADYNRLLQSVATGIGFLGAGAILRSNGAVQGITTAASIWAMGAVGAAAGGGAIFFALILTVMTYLILRWSGDLPAIDERARHKDESRPKAGSP